jgi:hypothetical protein
MVNLRWFRVVSVAFAMAVPARATTLGDLQAHGCRVLRVTATVPLFSVMVGGM